MVAKRKRSDNAATELSTPTGASGPTSLPSSATTSNTNTANHQETPSKFVTPVDSSSKSRSSFSTPNSSTPKIKRKSKHTPPLRERLRKTPARMNSAHGNLGTPTPKRPRKIAVAPVVVAVDDDDEEDVLLGPDHLVKSDLLKSNVVVSDHVQTLDPKEEVVDSEVIETVETTENFPQKTVHVTFASNSEHSSSQEEDDNEIQSLANVINSSDDSDSDNDDEAPESVSLKSSKQSVLDEIRKAKALIEQLEQDKKNKTRKQLDQRRLERDSKKTRMQEKLALIQPIDLNALKDLEPEGSDDDDVEDRDEDQENEDEDSQDNLQGTKTTFDDNGDMELSDFAMNMGMDMDSDMDLGGLDDDELFSVDASANKQARKQKPILVKDGFRVQALNAVERRNGSSGSAAEFKKLKMLGKAVRAGLGLRVGPGQVQFKRVGR